MDSPLKVPQKTILVVEDTALVLNTVRMILERAKFTVLAAASATEAMRLTEHAKTIDLLLSDVMMPDMSGPDLAVKLKELRPDMRVILMSGYPDGGMLVLNYGWYFIQSPSFLSSSSQRSTRFWMKRCATKARIISIRARNRTRVVTRIWLANNLRIIR